jgi:hypothetical protein
LSVGSGQTNNPDTDHTRANQSKSTASGWGASKETGEKTSSGDASLVASLGTGDSLPRLRQDWVSNLKRCKKGDKLGDCWHATKGSCHFWHVEPPLGIPPDSKATATLDPKDVNISERSGLFTAAYTDPLKKKIIYVENGPLAKLSSREVYWYPTEKDALAALETVVAAYQQQSS